MNTNRDYLADWCKQQEPIQGYDQDRGNDGRGNLSGVEDVILDPGTGQLVYINPRIRVSFFTSAQATSYLNRLRADTGATVTLEKAGNFDTSIDPLGRAAYYANIDGFRYPLNRFRYFASTGKDENGKQVYSDKDYNIGVDGPGKFTYTEIPEEQRFPGGPAAVIGFIPERR